MRKAIEERYSVRTFDPTPLRADDVAYIRERVDAARELHPARLRREERRHFMSHMAAEAAE